MRGYESTTLASVLFAGALAGLSGCLVENREGLEPEAAGVLDTGALAEALEGDGLAVESSPRTVFVHLFEWRWSDIAHEWMLGQKSRISTYVERRRSSTISTVSFWF